MTTNILKQMFNDSQTISLKQFSTLIKNTKNHILDQESGLENIFEIIKIILLQKKNELPLRITIFFKNLIDFLKQEENGSLILQQMFDFLIDQLSCKNNLIRRKSLLLLKNFDIKKIHTKILAERLFDKDKNVRKETINLLKNFQKEVIHEKITINKIFKEIIKHDNCYDVRKEALRCLEINLDNYNAIIQRAIDVSVHIRKFFYTEILNSLDFKKMKNSQKVLILKSAFLESEFNSKEILCRKILEDYKENVKEFVEDFYSGDAITELEEIILKFTSLVNLQFDLQFLNSLNEPLSLLLIVFLKYSENNFGRESLCLVPLNTFLEFFYKNIKEKKEVTFLINMFRVLGFYEIFEEDSYKIVKSTILKIFNLNILEEFTEEVLKLPFIGTDILFLGKFVKKHQKNENVLIFCKSIFKNLSFTDLHQAIIDEVLFSFSENNKYFLECIFYLISNHKKMEYLKYLTNEIELSCHLLTDLYLSNITSPDYVNLLLEYLNQNLNEKNVVLAIKISVYDKTEIFLPKIIELKYKSKNLEAQNLILLFLQEFFKVNSQILIRNFSNFLLLMPKKFHYSFADLAFNVLQEINSQEYDLFIYNVLLYMYKNFGINQNTLIDIIDCLYVLGNDLNLFRKISCLVKMLMDKKVKLGKLNEKIKAINADFEVDEAKEDVLKDLGLDG